MARASLLAQSVAKLLESEAGGDRFVDLCISLRVHGTDEEVLRVGGRWDRRRKVYCGDAERVRVLRVHRGQEKAARWFAEWLQRRASGDWAGFRRVWSAMFVGGRRGGKSRLATWAVCMFAVAFSGTQAWCISPTQEETDELERAIRETLPARYFRYRGDPKWEFRLANGSSIRMLSGHKPSTLKRGRVDFALYNEGQLMSKQGYIQLRGATADSGGLTIIAANPPDQPIGRWVEDLYERARAAVRDEDSTGDRGVRVEAFDFSPEMNPFIEYQSLTDLAAEVDDHTYRREVLGEFVPIGDVVFYAWSDAETVRDVPPSAIDVTEEFTYLHLGRRFRHVVGCDFQRTPHMAAAVFKVYVDGQAVLELAAELTTRSIAAAKGAAKDGRSQSEIEHGSRSQAVRQLAETQARLWIVDEAIIENADEDDLIDALEAPSLGVRCPCCREAADGYKADECAVIADASGEWQDAERTKGRGSFDWFRRRGWRWIYQPDEGMKRNPEITERVKVGNALLRSYEGRRRLFSCRHNEQLNRAMKRWENRNGAPHRKGEFAHACDAVTYPCWRFFPRRKETGDLPSVKVLKRYSRRGQMRSW